MHLNTMPDIDARQAVLADLDALATLFDQYRQFQDMPSDLTAARSFLRARIDHSESVLFIALDHDTPVGMAQLYPSFSSVKLSRVFILNDLFVIETGRRRGVASALLAAVETYAWASSASRVTLNVARENAAGQALYRRLGWTQDQQFYMFHRFPTST